MEIVYEDESILVVNKPAGILSIQDGYNSDLPHVRTFLEPEYGKLWIVHRLDKETSGILLLARNSESHKFLNDQFSQREIKKEYHAVIEGSLMEDVVSAEYPLKINGDRKHRTVINTQIGKSACTVFRIQKKSDELSLVSAYPETGYRHQIRTHLSALNHPILGDLLYGSKDELFTKFSDLIQRLALHSYQITFLHPISKNTINLCATYPQDFSLLVNHI